MKNKKVLLQLFILIFLCFPTLVFAKVNGKVEKIENFRSKYIQSRNIYIWLPADYSSKSKYAVLYLQDGNENLFNSNNNGIDAMITNLLNEGKIRKTIVVAVPNGGNLLRHSEYYPQKSLQFLPEEKRNKIIKNLLAENPRSDNYLLFLTKELKPYIDKKYSTFSNQSNTFIGGSSMGGLISLYAISEYPNIFGGAVCLSTHFMGATSPEDVLDKFVPNSIKEYFAETIPSPQNHKIFFSYGNKGMPEAYYKMFQTPIDILMKDKGFTEKNWITKEFEGGEHNAVSWAKQLPIALEFLLKK